MTVRHRIVIVGGGAVGTSILWHLATAGETDTVLVEKHELTAGSTWHAAGNVPTFSNTWLGQRAGNYAWQLYAELAADPDDPITYRQTQAVWPGHTESRMDHFQHLLGISKGLGLDLHMVSPVEMSAMHPYWEDDGTVIAGLLDPYEGDIDPSQLTQAFARRARALGASVRRHTRVVEMTQTGDGWCVGCESADGPFDIECEIVINASGFYGAEIGRLAGVELPVANLEHQYLITEPVDGLADQSIFPLVRDPELMFYLRREQDAFLFGNYGHAGRTVWADRLPETFDSRLFPPSTDDIADTAEKAMAHVPVLGEVGIARFVNGPIAYAPDAQPLCGPTPGLPGFFQATAFQIGITHAAAAGKALTEMITSGDTEWDMWAWDPRRFGSWATSSYANARVSELYEHQYDAPFPHRIWESGRPVQHTPLAPTLADRGANFGQIAGWERAFWFSSDVRYSHDTLSYRDEAWHDAVEAECIAVRDHVGVMDHGGFTRYEVSGPDAAAFLERMFVGRVPSVGRVKLSYMLRANGAVWSEATIAHIDDDRFLLLGPTAARERDIDWLCAHKGEADVSIEHGTTRTSTLMVMGPSSRELLARVSRADLSVESAPWMSVRDIEVAGIGCTALRVSFVGELGWELHVDDDDLVTLYAALHESGADLQLTDFGSYALNAMRIEKGYHGWGSEFGVEYTPFDANIGRFIAFDKPDFIGRDAVLAMRDDVPTWAYRVFSLDITGLPGHPADPAPSAPIMHNGDVAGYVTSASAGFRTGKRIALGFVEARFAADTAGITIDVLGTTCPATVHTRGLYDPDHRRPRA